jgi:hypothetical protein
MGADRRFTGRSIRVGGVNGSRYPKPIDCMLKGNFQFGRLRPILSAIRWAGCRGGVRRNRSAR